MLTPTELRLECAKVAAILTGSVCGHIPTFAEGALGKDAQGNPTLPDDVAAANLLEWQVLKVFFTAVEAGMTAAPKDAVSWGTVPPNDAPPAPPIPAGGGSLLPGGIPSGVVAILSALSAVKPGTPLNTAADVIAALGAIGHALPGAPAAPAAPTTSSAPTSTVLPVS